MPTAVLDHEAWQVSEGTPDLIFDALNREVRPDPVARRYLEVLKGVLGQEAHMGGIPKCSPGRVIGCRYMEGRDRPAYTIDFFHQGNQVTHVLENVVCVYLVSNSIC